MMSPVESSDAGGEAVPSGGPPPQPSEPVPRHSDLPTIEGLDARLAQALADLEDRPTTETHEIVAAEYHRLCVLDRAYEHLTAAIALAPGDAGAYDARARVWRDWGHADLGLGDAARAVFHAPKSAPAHNTLGTLLFVLGQLDAAQTRFEMAMALDPDAAWIRNNLCYTGLMRGDATLARSRCEEALVLDPALEAARNNLALDYAALGQADDARRVLGESGGAAPGHFNMGILFLSRREYERAAIEFDEAGRERPSLGEAVVRAMEARRLLVEKEKGGRDD
jgi:Tfp pilus assembly protein PilF